MTKRVLLPLFLLALSLTVSTSMAQDYPLYQEPYRPQYHYSPPCGWMNDPNGMVYYQGEYHLFYQFSPQVSKGHIHWGHAVSPDLVHWQTLPMALDPDAIGDIWSGSAVVDADNTSDLVPGGGLVAIFSYDNQSQGVASSSDNGRTWTKYSGNPVIPAMAKDFRDPKVFWDAPRSRWVMILAAGHKAQIYTSPNLLDWTLRSHFSEGQVQPIWEVPDLFPLQIDGQTKWVMLVSLSALAPAGGNGIQYFIGSFDGETFTNDNPHTILWLDYGTDNYAGTTWDSAPDNRRIYIGWMSNWQTAMSIPTARWRGATTLPRELRLINTTDGIRLAQTPIESLGQLRALLGTWDNVDVSGDMPLDVHGRTLEIIAEFEAGSAVHFGLDVHRGGDGKTRIVYNTAQSQLLISRADAPDAPISNFTPVFGAPTMLDNRHLRLHLFVDESSVETFAQNGLVTLSAQTFGNPSDDSVALFADKGDAKLVHLEIYSMASVWPLPPEEASLTLSGLNKCV